LQFYLLPEDTTFIKHAVETGKLNSDVSTVVLFKINIKINLKNA